MSVRTKGQNLVQGHWIGADDYVDLIDPMTGKVMGKMPNPSREKTQDFVSSLKDVPKYGLHNPFLNPERYLLYGDVSRKAAEELNKKDV